MKKVIYGGTVCDVSGSAPVRQDILIEDGRIEDFVKEKYASSPDRFCLRLPDRADFENSLSKFAMYFQILLVS